MATVVLTLAFLALFFILMSVRVIFKKDGEFQGTCASQSPYLNKEGEPCGFCGKTMDGKSSCKKEENPVSKVLARFN